MNLHFFGPSHVVSGLGKHINNGFARTESSVIVPVFAHTELAHTASGGHLAQSARSAAVKREYFRIGNIGVSVFVWVVSSVAYLFLQILFRACKNNGVSFRGFFRQVRDG